MNPVLIIGCGDIGRRVAARYLAENSPVTGVTRRPEAVAALAADGLQALCADLDAPASLAGLPLADAGVFYFAPPPGEGVSDPRIRAFLAAVEASGQRPARLVYISTTGVYGDCGGAWITEDQPVAPRTERGKRRLDAETQLRAWSARGGVPVVILRVPGIYGPGRLPVARLKKNLPVLDAAQAPYSNRIHAEDLAEVCIAAMARGEPGAVYNVADNAPTTMSDYFNRIADHLGLPRPPAVNMDEARDQLTPAMLSFIEESRRIDNRKLREALGITLRYPDLDAGLASIDPRTFD